GIPTQPIPRYLIPHTTAVSAGQGLLQMPVVRLCFSRESILSFIFSINISVSRLREPGLDLRDDARAEVGRADDRVDRADLDGALDVVDAVEFGGELAG